MSLLHTRLARFAALLCSLCAATITNGATLPAGFAETRVATGLASPTAMTIAPDGRIFVAQQGGALRVVKNGALLTQPFLTVSVNASGERGLLGVAFDPNFASNNFVYVYYTTSAAPDPQPREPLHRQRCQSGRRGSGERSAAPESAEPELGDQPQRRRDSLRHRRQALHRGGRERQQRQLRRRSTPRWARCCASTPDGSIPSDNPFFSQTTGINQAIWARGLRNPFTFAVDPHERPHACQRRGRGHVGGGQSRRRGLELRLAADRGKQSGRRRGRALSDSHLSATRGGRSARSPVAAFYRPTTATFPAEYAGPLFLRRLLRRASSAR